MDISNFFATIDRNLLTKLLLDQITHPLLAQLITVSVQTDPRQNVIMASPPSKYQLVNPVKSFFTQQSNQGIQMWTFNRTNFSQQKN